MTNHRPFAQPTASLPAPHTVLAHVIRNMPSESFATVAEITRRVGHHQRSVPVMINVAVNRTYAEPLHKPRRYPQAYRLTDFGRLVKASLEG
jgi:hypothetical protein